MEQPFILMLECDEDDRYITQTSFKENDLAVDLLFKNNSIDFFSYLDTCRQKGSAYPSMILLDMNAVPLNAVEILKELKTSADFNHIPVVVLSENAKPGIVKECYTLGASSFITKPDSHAMTDKKIFHFLKYWFETVELV